MSPSFFFYDLETSGLNPKDARIMQFAGLFTDLDLKTFSDPFNLLLKLTTDTLPEPQAILTTGIIPQKSLTEGISDVDFLNIFNREILNPGIIFAGYNSIRFDDEFMRYLLYRNFYDPYEWQWKDGRSRWDLLDVFRLIRALRPEGVNWPFSVDGKPTNRLELLTKQNGINHIDAHDALSDVSALIAMTRLVRDRQPEMFDVLLNLRKKSEVEKLIKLNEAIIYTSGSFSSEFLHTTAVLPLVMTKSGVVVYDLRADPRPFLAMTGPELLVAMTFVKEDNRLRLPIKELRFNRCPALWPDRQILENADVQDRIKLTPKLVSDNRQKILNTQPFITNLAEAWAIKTSSFFHQTSLIDNPMAVDGLLYDGFISEQDKSKCVSIHHLPAERLSQLTGQFEDPRLNTLLPLFKARNFPESLTKSEREAWSGFCASKLLSGKNRSKLNLYFREIERLQSLKTLSTDRQKIVSDLKRYGDFVRDTVKTKKSNG